MLCLALVTDWIVDLSGWTATWKGWLGRWLGVQVGSVRPFDCGLCASWWVGIIYLLCTHNISIPYIAFSALLAGLNKPIDSLIGTITFALSTGIMWINSKLQSLWEK